MTGAPAPIAELREVHRFHASSGAMLQWAGAVTNPPAGGRIDQANGRFEMSRVSSVVLAACLAALFALTARHGVVAQSVDWPAVDRALGRPGAAQPGGVYKFSFPRTDLHV